MINQQTLIVVVFLLFILGFAALYFQLKKLVESRSNSDEVTKLLTQLISEMRGSVDKTNFSMIEQTKAINKRLDQAARIIASVSKSVGEMTEIGRSMRELQEFLRSPKVRGQIGESVLGNILRQTLPTQNFHLQYAFKSGEIVDAALKLEQGIIPIDAKFPMENFRKMIKSQSDSEREIQRKLFVNDVKKHIDSIASKYIRPQEGTLDFALMYIPSEPVYYDILTNNPELDEYAYKKRVRPVSPNTLYAYLRAIIMSLEGSKIEKQTARILAALREISDETDKFGTSLAVLTKHVKNAASASDEVGLRFSRLSSKVSSLKMIESDTQDKLK